MSTSPKSFRTEIKISLANPILATSGFEQPGPGGHSPEVDTLINLASRQNSHNLFSV